MASLITAPAESPRLAERFNLGFLCSRTVRSRDLSEAGPVFREILGVYDDPENQRPHPELVVDPNYRVWWDFAEEHDSGGNRLRRFVQSLGDPTRLQEQRAYLGELSNFCCVDDS